MECVEEEEEEEEVGATYSCGEVHRHEGMGCQK